MSMSRISRLRLERYIVYHELPQFRLCGSIETPYFTGWQKTTQKLQDYKLKLLLPKWYPDQMPCLYVVYPKTLYKYSNWETINSEGVSHAFHTQANGHDGCVQICHDHNWDASKTCVGVLMKGIIWLEAYERHLKTGFTIAEIIDQLKRRQENGL